MADDQVEMMDGVEITEEPQNQSLMTEDELRIVTVYRRFEELQFEIAVLKAKGVLSRDEITEHVSEKDIVNAQEELLKAGASFVVQRNAVEAVLISNPILNAVHANSNASAIEQDLLPLVQQRDEFSVTLSQLSKEVLDARNALKETAMKNKIISQENVKLAKTMVALAEEADTHWEDNIEDPAIRKRLDALEAGMKSSHQKWRIIKGTASAMIAGSGVDWSRDPHLVNIVLDNED